jgi:cysteine desulfurase
MDWAATAPLCKEAAIAMEPFVQGGKDNIIYGGNANSLHSIGRDAFSAMEHARETIARGIGARPDELIFTSGATEADNQALLGLTRAAIRAHTGRGEHDFKAHIITSSIEHDAVINTAKLLEDFGCEVTFIGPDSHGFIDPQRIAQAMRPSTVLVSVMLANNELGSIQPIHEIAQIAHQGGALCHTDAVQALGKMIVDVNELDVDAMSLSAHKICGPKGVGALYVRHSDTCDPLIRGGGQESGARSGTQNVCGMVGFAAAFEALCGDRDRLLKEAQRQRALRDQLYERLCSYDCVHMNVPCAPGSENYLPNIVDVHVDGFESETMILRMDFSGVAISGGSACASHSLDPSRILLAIGMQRDAALCSLRFSIGRYTNQEDIDACMKAFDTALHWDKRKEVLAR